MKFYLLTDTLPESIFCYVGMTKKSLLERKAEHWDNFNGNILKRNWIKYVKIMGGNLIIKELEDFEAEKNWIYAYQINRNYISLNSSTDLKSSEHHSENILTNPDFKYSHFRRFSFGSNYLYPHYKQQRKFYITHHLNFKIEEYLPILNYLFFSSELDDLSYPSEILQNHDFKVDLQFLLMIRDLCLYYSAFEKKFYFDLYSRFLHQNPNDTDILITEFTAYKNLQIPFYSDEFWRYLKITRRSHLQAILEPIFKT